MALNNYKASPAISTDTVYEVWKKGIKVSSSFTSYEKGIKLLLHFWV